MSDPKYSLLELLPSLRSQAQGISDPEIKSRFKFLKVVAESPKSVRKKCREEGRSHQTFYKWAEILIKTQDVMCLKSRSRKPTKSPNQTPKRITKRVRKLRLLEPFSGPERISQDLKEHYNIKCPPSTVYAVLKREKLITAEHAKRLNKKHLKRYRRPLPGWLQMDFKYVPYLIENRQYYQLSCVDHHSSWRFIRCYPHKSEEFVVQFLRELEMFCPFPIMQLQTDNDAAFTDKFSSQKNRPTGLHPVDLWCASKGIEHRLIPVGEKELNGKVENTHRFDDREFFSQIRCLNFRALDDHSRFYNQRWNERRKTKTLGWKTPLQVIDESYVRAVAFLLHISLRSPGEQSLVKMTESGDMMLPIFPDEKPIKKIKRPGLVDRYLQYMDWEERQRLKALVPLVAMSQIFSVWVFLLFVGVWVTRNLPRLIRRSSGIHQRLS